MRQNKTNTRMGSVYGGGGGGNPLVKVLNSFNLCVQGHMGDLKLVAICTPWAIIMPIVNSHHQKIEEEFALQANPTEGKDIRMDVIIVYLTFLQKVQIQTGVYLLSNGIKLCCFGCMFNFNNYSSKKQSISYDFTVISANPSEYNKSLQVIY